MIERRHLRKLRQLAFRRFAAVLVGVVTVAAAITIDVACVPSAEEVYPRGAVNLTTTPSPGTRGEPFTTSDGWTIRISTVVVQALIGAQGPPPDMISNGAVHLFHGSKRQEFVIPRIDEGTATALVSLTSLGIGPDYARIPGYYSGANRDVEPELIARFAKLADDEDPSPPVDDPATPAFDESTTVASENGPALLLTGVAEKNGKVLRFDFTLQASFIDVELPVMVRRNVLNDVVAVVAIEQLFNHAESCRIGVKPLQVGQTRPTRLEFDDVAAADRDGDGVLSPDELRFDERRHELELIDAGIADAGSYFDAGALNNPRSLADKLRSHACLIFMDR